MSRISINGERRGRFTTVRSCGSKRAYFASEVSFQRVQLLAEYRVCLHQNSFPVTAMWTVLHGTIAVSKKVVKRVSIRRSQINKNALWLSPRCFMPGRAVGVAAAAGLAQAGACCGAGFREVAPQAYGPALQHK